MLLVDTSVVVKWFHERDEPELEASRAILDAHRTGTVQARVIDLASYELGNVLLRALRQPPLVVQDSLSLLLRICEPVVRPAPSWYSAAARSPTATS